MRLLILILAALPIPGAPPELSPTESAVVRLLNEARTAPATFARRHISPHARESREAAECLREMTLLAPLPPLTVAAPLVQSARDHAESSAAANTTGHQGADGSNLDQRISRYADWVGGISENLYYGRDDAEEFVVQLLIDRGVAGRGHRRNILNAKMAAAGVAVRRHPRYGSICVMDFASLLRPLQQRRAR